MTRLLDGPAVGEVLMLKRAPQYLRVVRDVVGKWDALDQLTDVPRSDETIVVYQMVGEPTSMHINRGRRGCDWYRGGEYRVLDPQPAEHVLRSTSTWRAWVGEQIGAPVAADGTMEDGQ